MPAAAHTDGGIDILESRNPATGEVLDTVPVLGSHAVDAAVERARDAAAIWGAMPPPLRREHLLNWRRELAAHADAIAELIHRENGKTLLDGVTEVLLSLSHLTFAATRATKALRAHTVSTGLLVNFRARISYHPVGVVGVIGPWNYPLFTPMGSIGYALAAGNAVVFKPSELTPLVGQLFQETADAAIPVPHLLQVVTGDERTGAALAGANLGKLAFTGSTATGKKIMTVAAKRLTPVVMELGGNDPLIVAADADVDKAAEAAVYGAFANAGQSCVSVERAFVHDDVYDRFVDLVTQEVDGLRSGAGPDAHIGAMTRPRQIDVIREHIRDAIAKGATAIVGGDAAIQGPFVSPTVLVDLTPDMKVMREETFGPVLPIIKVSNVDQAVQQANATQFGLGSSVFADRDAQAIADRIRAGSTSINAVMAYSGIPALPFGGVGDSGFGRVHGDAGLREFSRVKSTAEERFRAPFNATSFRQPANAYKHVRSMITQLFGGGVIDQIGSTWRKFRS